VSKLFCCGHLVLALSMVFWRVFGGGSFAESAVGRLLALVTLIACVLGALAVLIQSVRRWRDPRVALLALAFVLALASRQRVDVFDLVYATLAIGLSVWWFRCAGRATRPAPR